MRRVDAIELCSEQGSRTGDCIGESRAYTYSLTWIRCAPVGRVLSERLAKENAFLFLGWCEELRHRAERRASVSTGLSGWGKSVLCLLFLLKRAL